MRALERCGCQGGQCIYLRIVIPISISTIYLQQGLKPSTDHHIWQRSGASLIEAHKLKTILVVG